MLDHQGDTLAPYLFIIVLDYVLRILDTDRHLGFTLKEARSRRILEENITDADFADYIAVFSNRIRDIEILLNQIEQRATTVGLHIISEKNKIYWIKYKRICQSTRWE